jgi:hypothetical protein
MGVQVECGEDEHAGVASRRHDAPGRLDAIEARHAEVHHRDVRCVRGHQSHRLFPVVRLTDHLDPGELEDEPQPAPDHRLDPPVVSPRAQPVYAQRSMCSPAPDS